MDMRKGESREVVQAGFNKRKTGSAGHSDLQRNSVKIPVITLTLAFIILLSGLTDLPRALSLGPVSLMAVFTALYGASLLLFWLTRPILTGPVLAAVWPLMALIFWGLTSFAWSDSAVAGLQNVAVLGVFLVCILVASNISYYHYNFQWAVWTMLGLATWIAVGLYGVSLAWGGLGNNLILGSRSFAPFALLGVAWYLATWRYNSRRGLWLAVIIVTTIGASLSRLGLGVALILFLLSQARLTSVRGWVRLSMLTALIAVFLYLTITHVEPLSNRFFEGDTQLRVGETEINVSGRGEMWRATLDSHEESPWIGKGAGSVGELPTINKPGRGHPHNDYLRILHDYGVVGLGLWLLLLAKLFWTTGNAWARADRRTSLEARPHLAAFLSLVALALMMIADNAMTYVWVMAPLGILVGASLGRVKLT